MNCPRARYLFDGMSIFQISAGEDRLSGLRWPSS
jgi:hypothetical protein